MYCQLEDSFKRMLERTPEEKKIQVLTRIACEAQNIGNIRMATDELLKIGEIWEEFEPQDEYEEDRLWELKKTMEM